MLASMMPLVDSGCAKQPPVTPAVPAPSPVSQQANDPIATLIGSEGENLATHQATTISRLGFTIQVGAFSEPDNAVRLERSLDAKGLDAYHFRHQSGLYKVRFANHASYGSARAQAEALQNQGVIGPFFIVSPEDYAVTQLSASSQQEMRQELVRTARRFLGTPYRWGGEDVGNGFDCSGLTMVSYRLNGLNLPRNSRSQFQSGRWVAKKNLQPGDLVFFATKGGKRVTHVGMYVGKDRFIHAPRTGQTVRIELLSNRFFAKAYVGGRSYL
ncbi:MAG: hydrolase [Desulfuromonas sp.]|nr:MAG: hydrolase [Desulfuromonas sp.]